MRSAKCTESLNSDPPKPRLITRCLGKSCANVFHSRMLELPMNRIAFCGGRLVRSLASKARISESHLFVCAAPVSAAAKRNQARTMCRIGCLGLNAHAYRANPFLRPRYVGEQRISREAFSSDYLPRMTTRWTNSLWLKGIG